MYLLLDASSHYLIFFKAQIQSIVLYIREEQKMPMMHCKYHYNSNNNSNPDNVALL